MGIQIKEKDNNLVGTYFDVHSFDVKILMLVKTDKRLVMLCTH